MNRAAGPMVTAVIVTYNSRDHVGAALDALAESHCRGELECVVVDNASSDGSAELVAGAYPWVELVRSSGNLGFGRGCNLGFEKVRTPYVLIHNPDAVIDREAVQRLIGFMDRKREAGIAAPALVYDEGVFQPVGMMITPASLCRTALGRPSPIPGAKVVAPGTMAFRTDWVCGAMMLIRSELYRRLGGFDPRFFLYFEETDLLRRAAAAGTEIWCVGEAVARHAGAASAKTTGKVLVGDCISEHFYRSRFYYLVKHFGWLRAIGSDMLDWACTHARWLRARLLGRSLPPDPRSGRPLLRLPVRPEGN